MVQVAADVGFERVTVRRLTQVAGVSTRTFYGQFVDREDCLASSVEAIGKEVLGDAAQGEVDGLGWQDRFRGALGSLLRSLAARPKQTRILLVESLSAGRSTRTRATGLTADLERLLSRLLEVGPASPPPPERLVVGITAGIVRVATTTTLTDRVEELPAMADDLSGWALDIYDGGRTVALIARVRKRPEIRRRRERSPFPAALSDSVGHGEYERILSAVSKLAAEKGLATLTVSEIRREAGVSRRGFDARFGGATECFLAAVESLARAAATKADRWAGTDGEKERRTYRTVLALCAMAARKEPQAKMVVVTILKPGREGLRCREELISEAADTLIERGGPPSCLAAEASVAAVWRIAQCEVMAGRAEQLPRCALLLSSMLIGPRSAAVAI